MFKRFTTVALALALCAPAFAQDGAVTGDDLVGTWTFDVDAMIEVMREQAEESGQAFPEDAMRGMFGQMVFELTVNEDGTYSLMHNQAPGADPEEETGTWSLEETEDGSQLTVVKDLAEGEEPEDDQVSIVVKIDDDHISFQDVNGGPAAFLVRSAE